MAGYIGTTPVPQATQHRESFTATGGQTSFATAGYTPQFIDVYLNGVKLAPADFTATNGSDVVLASGATASDILEIVAYTPFEIASQTFTGDTTANNFAVTGTFTSRGIDDNATSTAMTLDSSGEVGIGTSSPFDALHVEGTIRGNVSSASDENIRLTTTGGGGFVIDVDDATVANPTWSIRTFASEPLAFDIGGTERMRIDSSGNLLVGTATTLTGANLAAGETGAYLGSDGFVKASRDNGNVFLVNRNTSDGSLVTFQKDGSTVGSIGVGQSSDLYIGTSDTGILTSSSESITPWNPSTNVGRDDAIDLGTSDHRFQDLYLSGGVYLGGTGSANKLDDYEEGTWTVTNAGDSTGTLSSNGRYVKIGRQVTCHATVSVTASFSSSSLGGLPFNPDHNNALSAIHSAAVCVGGNVKMVSVNDASGNLTARDVNGGAVNPTSSQIMRFTIVYQTT